MDRFIGYLQEKQQNKVVNLKSSLDRFIESKCDIEWEQPWNLKSSLDRFIGKHSMLKN